MSASSTVCINAQESVHAGICRAPSCSLVTPEANKRVPIRPLKRTKLPEGDVATKVDRVIQNEEQEEEEEEQRELLEPRRLDMDQHVVLANPSLDAEEEQEEEEEVPITQPYPGEDAAEEGEIPASSSPSQDQVN
jgi:hypothetical protein